MRYCGKVYERGRPHMTIRHMRIAYWTPKATNTHSQYVTIIVLPLQKQLHGRATVSLSQYSACLSGYI